MITQSYSCSDNSISNTQLSTSMNDFVQPNPYSMCKLIVINCRGLKSKKDLFVHLIHSQSPHFIAGTESWLDPTTFSSEIFPIPTIRFFEKRSDGYGGVFFACINTINCSQVTITSPCECIVCRVELTNSHLI